MTYASPGNWTDVSDAFPYVASIGVPLYEMLVIAVFLIFFIGFKTRYETASSLPASFFIATVISGLLAYGGLLNQTWFIAGVVLTVVTTAYNARR